MTRGIQLSTSSSTSRSTGKKGGFNDNYINNNDSVSAHFQDGRTTDEDERIRTKGGVNLAGGSNIGRRSGRRSSTHTDIGQEDENMWPSSPRAARYTARTARKSSVHQVPMASIRRRASLESLSSDYASLDEYTSSSSAVPPRKQRDIFFSRTSYSTLVTITIALLAWSMVVQPTQAALSCTTDADCSAKGSAKCKQDRMTGASTCVYKSCSAGYWGAGNTYSDCFECPLGMTSLEGKAFYETDCFLPCGDNRCYIPEDGSTECNFEPATAAHMCSSSCNDASFSVINANKPYATCIRKVQHAVSSNSTSLTNQAKSSTNKRKVVRLLNKRGEVEGGRRLKLKKDVDLRHQGPAVALLRDAGRDPLALVSR